MFLKETNMSIFRKLAAAALALSLMGSALPVMAQVLPGQAGPFPLNLLDNGNFNLAQRGTTAKTGITNSATYLWDRWAGYGGSSSSVTLTNISSSLPAGANTPNFSNAAQVQRASSNSNTAQICLAQEIPNADILPLQGQPFTLSFWALAGGNFSAASSNLTVNVTTGTTSDQGLATLISGWAGAATPLNSLQPITANWQRFAWTGTFATNVQEAAAQLCFTPVGTAGTNDFFQATGIQLERGTIASNFEWRSPGYELLKDQRYAYQINEPAAGNPVGPAGFVTLTGQAFVQLPAPVTMRVAPTCTVTIGTFKGLEALAGTPATLTAAAGLSPTVNSLNLSLSSSSALSIGAPIVMAGFGGSGTILCTADF